MFFDRFILFVCVIVSGYAAMVPSGRNCRSCTIEMTLLFTIAHSSAEALCPDGRCVTQNVECVDAINSTTIAQSERINRETCVVPTLEHGHVSVEPPSSSTSNKAVHFECDSGFTLVGAASASCINGVWQGSMPECSKVHPGLCEVKNLPQFTYQCRTGNGEFTSCNKFVAEGSKVRVTRRVSSGITGVPVSVEILCNNGVFNVSLGCMKEIETLQNEFLHLTSGEITTYETNFNKIHQADLQFKESVNHFNHFEHQVKVKLNQMHRKIEECSIYFDLLLTSINQSYQEPSPAKGNQTCELPPNPVNGSYSVETLSNVDSSEPVDFALRYVCDRGLALVGTATPRCVNGVWQDEFPRCSAACKLPKNSDFVYQCLKEDHDDFCNEYVAVGSSVRVSRKESSGTTSVAVSISCLDNQKFNISSDCVQEIDQLQTDFERPTMEKMTYYESRFHELKDSTSFEFERMVHEFHSFEKQVTQNLTNMHQKAFECDVYLDLLLSSLTLSLDRKLLK